MEAYPERKESYQEEPEQDGGHFAIARHYKWVPYAKITPFLTILQGLPSDVLHKVPKQAT
jgi:hypothetical protein